MMITTHQNTQIKCHAEKARHKHGVMVIGQLLDTVSPRTVCGADEKPMNSCRKR